jgi:hypothetical protein
MMSVLGEACGGIEVGIIRQDNVLQRRVSGSWRREVLRTALGNFAS